MVIAYTKSKDQPGNVANPARGQLNGESNVQYRYDFQTSTRELYHTVRFRFRVSV